MRGIAIGLAAVVLIGAAPMPNLGSDLARMRDFAAHRGETLWQGYDRAPFGFLLIGGDRETLLCDDRLPAGFVSARRDAATGCAAATRARSGLPDKLLAAMPVFGPPSTIVMGTPESTGRSRGDWLRTILHEHFHQWQTTLPDYWARTDALDLANGDQTGMWMLNYAFPYMDPKVAAAHATASKALAAALAARRTSGFGAALTRYMAARRTFQASVSPADWRYAEFELWQEGAARWTEIALGKLYPDPAVRKAATDLERQTLEQLAAPDLANQGRVFVYPFGAGETMLLEACSPGWRDTYRGVLALGPLLDIALTRCGKAPS